MKITPINAVSVNKVRLNNKATNPVSERINPIQINPNQMFGVFYGKDLLSFKGKEFQQTIRDNYFQLPAGCTPDEFQVEAGEALFEGKDVLVEAPTGTGKTAIAHYAATNNMNKGKTTFYTTPLKALSNQKLTEFRSVYGDENVGILTGDRRENVEAPIIIMTTEVYRNMALSNMYGEKNPIMENLGTVIFDEFHYLGDPDRGPVWEESVMFTPKDVQTLELSATIGNPKELEAWIGGLKGDNVKLVSIPSEARHVPLTFDMFETQSYSKTERKIAKATRRGETLDEEEDLRVSKPKLSDFKTLVEQLNSKEQLPAILFIFSKKYSRELLEYMGSDGPDLTTDAEKEEIEKIVQKYQDSQYIGSDLNMQAIKKGYAIHNAGIIPGQKALIEELFQKKLLKTVIATETLAAGINMPAKTVVISSPYKPCDEDRDAGKLLDEDAKIKLEMPNEDEQDGEEEQPKVPVRMLTSNEYKQMAGRAGRRGIDKEGFVYSMPTDRSTEQDFLYLEAIDCNPINSNYTPDYGFLSSYYEHNDDTDKLDEIFGKTFFVQDTNKDESNNKLGELKEISDRKTQILLDRGFLSEVDGKIEPNFLANMAARVKGYDALTLAETIDSGVFEEITPQALSMVAASIAIPAKGPDGQIGIDTDLTPIFEATNTSVESIYQRLTTKVESMLTKFGKTMDSFENYDDMLAFAESIEKPEASKEEIQEAMRKLSIRRSKMYTITKSSPKYDLEVLVAQLKHDETVPTKVLEKAYKDVQDYEKKIHVRSIEDHIEKLQNELDSIEIPSRGMKVRAKLEKRQRELKQDIRFAQNMAYLRDNVEDALVKNDKFIKKNPPTTVRGDYDHMEAAYTKATLKDELVDKIKTLKSMVDSGEMDEQADVQTMEKDMASTNAVYKTLLDNSLEIYKTEIDNGINAVPPKYNKITAQMLYAWSSLNQANPDDTMFNWEQLLRMIPEDKADEGSIYRTIMQTADLLSQIGEMAEVGVEKSPNREYYQQLRETAYKARESLIKYPVEI